ncbi:glycerate dehydrogenase [Ectothiorhodospira haloalkaliphila]|uniref:Glycerate dehydrogenase n=1 Tax=Ectothiorhodospira haloalkaliphila TaxID=421628 RepID=W8KJ59_9GAMM|nr:MULTISPECIES: 2-hydroxyacid dehydrogenase [Ectothiorhodospira]AHK79819.1 glycerate dehydrogenase [Ectothiorhodospira haloalkaliphila]MCG5494126.1 2-hydroxyacid dehydrogenase [Ectothiorhodospira variabilis]MCG5497357.1 2-hydroxyacid dehydrogenase [Ectothiorhodospira variabilis]MCG5503344.1 2-hydroxyacid dehydrogenase [Ectothiorhodospira variabilis]MCG5506568.1 2-hydroxyacid dehydrogenase [Ectothiorhodospira variabilis]
MIEQGVFLDLETLDRGDLDLSPLHDSLTRWTFHDYTRPPETVERIQGAQVVITNKVVLDADALAAAPDLKLVCLAATGTNNVDLEAASRLGITVCNVRDYATASVVQHVFAMLLSLTVRLSRYHDDVRSGAWNDSRQFCLLDHPIRELDGRRLGIIGYGVLGRATAQAAQAFGMDVAVAQSLTGRGPEPGRLALDEVIGTSDVLSLHCPLTPETHQLIDEHRLRMMKSDAVLINTARGAIVDNAALAEALRRGEIGGAGVDVLEKEPPEAGHPLLAADIPNLIITPHIAWAAVEARQRMVDALAANIQAFKSGQPTNQVSP